MVALDPMSEGRLPGSSGERVDFHGLEILAPMVRASQLPFRIECLKYGADLVYGEEIIDRKIIGAARVENTDFNTIDFVSPREKTAVFTTCAEERSKVFFQLGTANSELATEAALLVSGDVRGIDINMGCPKSFSVKGGMGAALLETPDVAADILTRLRRNLPASCALTCKIRMLASTAKTRDFMQLCERSGAEAITVHMRRREERPACSAHWDEIVRLWDAVRVPVIANGDFFSRRQIDEFWKHCRGECLAAAGGDRQDGKLPGPAAIMVARGALWNPSIFCRRVEEAPPFEDMVRSFVKAAARYNSTYQNTKWILSQMLAGGTGVTTPTDFQGQPMKAFNRRISTTKSMASICQLIGQPFEVSEYAAHAHTTNYYRERLVAVPRLCGDGESPEVGTSNMSSLPVSRKRKGAAEELDTGVDEDGKEGAKHAKPSL